MAQFQNIAPGQLVTRLVQDQMIVQQDIHNNVLPQYHKFVMNLMKTLPTPAEELHHAGTGIAGEGGEILDVTKKVWVYNKPLDVPHLIEELGDLRFYYQAMLNLLGITDDMVIAQNMQKLRVRYADGKYSDAQANARADKAPPAPLSAEGSKGTSTPEPRKFMGQPEVAKNIHDAFDAEVAKSIRQLRRDEQP